MSTGYPIAGDGATPPQHAAAAQESARPTSGTTVVQWQSGRRAAKMVGMPSEFRPEPAPGNSAARPATDTDSLIAVRTLTKAFADYPWTRHTLAADDHEQRLATFQELFLTRIGLPHGKVWIAGDGAAVAVWTTPATDAGPVFAELGPRFIELAGDRAEAHRAAEAALAPHRPTEPAWFLGTIGVDPAHQGRGLGRTVIEPGLAAAAEEGAPAYLETSTESNVGFYERLGFRVTAEVDIPDDGPRTWCMQR